MKTKRSISLERVLSDNIEYRTFNGRGSVIFHAKSGKKSESIKSALMDYGVEFNSVNDVDEMVKMSEYFNENVPDNELKGKDVKIVRFTIKIDNLKDVSPSLFIELKGNSQISELVLQYLTDENLLDGYVLN